MNKDTFSAMSAAAIRQIGEFGAQQLSNTAWAFAKLAVEDETLFHALSSAFIRNRRQFDASNINNIHRVVVRKLGVSEPASS